jgi:hypothetical protein
MDFFFSRSSSKKQKTKHWNFFSKLRTMEMKSLQLRIFFESKMGSHVGPMTKIPLIRFVHIQKAMQM